MKLDTNSLVHTQWKCKYRIDWRVAIAKNAVRDFLAHTLMERSGLEI